MREYKRRLWLGALMVLSLLAGTCIPASTSADTLLVSTGAPDLIIDTVTWSPETPLVNETVTFIVTAKNQGNEQADSSSISYYTGDVYQASDPVNQIAAGATATKTFKWSAQAGSLIFKAVTDDAGSISESN